jgi:H/ACA ribonucleoprotein complex subunit 4
LHNRFRKKDRANLMSVQFLLPSDIPQTYVSKCEDTTDPKYGSIPSERPLEYYIDCGIVNLDKPAGPTSHEVASWVRKILNLSKTGHGGTLDPQVTGILPVSLGNATKVIGALLSAGKEYVASMFLHRPVPEEKVISALKLFTGELYQRPPIKSSVVRRLRTRTIYYSEFLEFHDQHVLFRVGCEAGTYIRKLCFDLGEALLSGAHMEELRRTRTGIFKEDESFCTLQDLKDAYTIYQQEKDDRYLRKLIQPMEKAIAHWKKIYIRDSAVDAIAHGANLAVAGVVMLERDIQKGEDIALMTLKGELVAFGTALQSTPQILKANHGLVVKTNRVFMLRGIYPNWRENPKETTPPE